VPAPAGMPFQPIKTAANTFPQPGAGAPGFTMPTRTPRTSPGYGGTQQQPAYGGVPAAGGYNPGGYNPGAVNAQSTPGTMSLSDLGTTVPGAVQFKSWPPENHSASEEEVAAMNLLQRTSNPNIPPVPGVPEPGELDNPNAGRTAPVTTRPTGPTRLPNGQVMPQ
jgi:hypothetical protein